MTYTYKYSYTSTEAELFAICKLCGLEREDGKHFTFNDRRYRAKIRLNDAAIKSFGGKRRAYNLMGYAIILEALSAGAGGSVLSGMVAPILNRLAVDYPLLATYAESVKIGALLHLSLRRTA